MTALAGAAGTVPYSRRVTKMCIFLWRGFSRAQVGDAEVQELWVRKPCRGHERGLSLGVVAPAARGPRERKGWEMGLCAGSLWVLPTSWH